MNDKKQMTWPGAPADLNKMKLLQPSLDPTNASYDCDPARGPWELVEHSGPWADQEGAPLDGLACRQEHSDWTMSEDELPPEDVDLIYDELLYGLFLSDRYVGEAHHNGSNNGTMFLRVWLRETGEYVGFLMWDDMESVAKATWHPANVSPLPVSVLRGHEELVAKLVSLGL